MKLSRISLQRLRQRLRLMATVLAGACVVCSAFVMSTFATADDSEQSADTQSETKPVVKKKAKGGKGTREKDADGTEAPHQFEANTVIKSQYKLNGQPLEVDPD